LRCEAHGGFGRRFGETHRRQRRQGAPDRPHYGRELIVVDRWFPSSKLCGSCGTVRAALPLGVRGWECACGAVHDRDVNAARNILAAGLAVAACGDGVRPQRSTPGGQSSMKQEIVPTAALAPGGPAARPRGLPGQSVIVPRR
ncbi:zinc ribbon domain-containing protein, partial [Kitasatospora sp. NPDC088134]|uniref:zinc ribbon domain-containing protein n=1 Tax=Kitasatospora sp. NPDC088134 TaxID=3364071 RepID=UPI00380FE391